MLCKTHNNQYFNNGFFQFKVNSFYVSGHVQINIPQGHWEVEDDGTDVEHEFKELTACHAAGHVEVPHGVAVERRHRERRHCSLKKSQPPITTKYQNNDLSCTKIMERGLKMQSYI